MLHSNCKAPKVTTVHLSGWTSLKASSCRLDRSCWPSSPGTQRFPFTSRQQRAQKLGEKFSPQSPSHVSELITPSRCRHDPDFTGYRKPKLALPRFSLNRSFQLCQMLENLLSLEYCVRDKSQSFLLRLDSQLLGSLPHKGVVYGLFPRQGFSYHQASPGTSESCGTRKHS